MGGWRHCGSGRKEGTPAPCWYCCTRGLGCIDLWRDFPQRLASRSGFGVFAYSRVGYGRSDPCTLPRPLTYMHHEAENILPQVLESLEAESVILVGHSDGASIAAIHAGGTPDPRLSGLILMGPHFFAEPVSIRSIAEAKTAYETGTLREGLAKYHGDNVDCAFRGWNDAWLDPEFRHWNLTGFLPNIRVPVLFIQGKEDQYGTLRQLAALKRHLPSSPDSRVIGQSRHSPPSRPARRNPGNHGPFPETRPSRMKSNPGPPATT